MTSVAALARERAVPPSAVVRACAPYRVASPFEDARRMRNLERYGAAHKPGNVGLVVGLNPGIHGQMQTGIPFTDNARLSWYSACVPGLEPSPHRRIEQSSRLLYSVLDDVAPATRGASALHERLVLVNAFPHCLLMPDKDAHPTSIEPLLRESAVRAESAAWIASVVEALRPTRIVALTNYSLETLRDAGVAAGAEVRRAPHPRALMYERGDGAKPRRAALSSALAWCAGQP